MIRSYPNQEGKELNEIKNSVQNIKNRIQQKCRNVELERWPCC